METRPRIFFEIATFFLLLNYAAPTGAQTTTSVFNTPAPVIAKMSNYTDYLNQTAMVLYNKAVLVVGPLQVIRPEVAEYRKRVADVLAALKISNFGLFYEVMSKPCLTSDLIDKISAVTEKLHKIKSEAEKISILNSGPLEPLLHFEESPFPAIIEGLHEVCNLESEIQGDLILTIVPTNGTENCGPDMANPILNSCQRQSGIQLQNTINAYNNTILNVIFSN